MGLGLFDNGPKRSGGSRSGLLDCVRSSGARRERARAGGGGAADLEQMELAAGEIG